MVECQQARFRHCQKRVGLLPPLHVRELDQETYLCGGYGILYKLGYGL